ncbi:ribosomal protein L5 domain-containing protein [Globomyces pollinis-pini]|nr:ribosomal protein L5 domain-containing protein [Globomyces pollinis-pini]KAJ2992795.1 hypothetical protein HDV02_002851 [Globomyces sp. JEL0801]
MNRILVSRFTKGTQILRRYSTDAVQEVPEIVNPLPVIPRLETHYYNTLYQDINIISYDHDSVAASLEHLELCGEWNQSLSPTLMDDTFSVHLSKLPTRPTTELCTNLYSTKLAHVGLQKDYKNFKKPLLNPIDYTKVTKEYLNAPKFKQVKDRYSPLPSRTPALRKIDLKIWTEDAVANKSILLSAILSLQCITGIRGDPVFATNGDASKKIRAGMPLGAKVELRGQDMYHFLDKMVQCVLPRIREWEGLNPVGNGSGQMKLVLPSSAVGTFPDIEPHFDSFPRLFDIEVTMYTSAKNDWETILLLSGFQLPFLPEVKVEEVKEVVSDDPWARIKAAKTSEERKALFAQISAERKKKK